MNKAEKCRMEIEEVLKKYKADLIHVRGSEAVLAITAKGVLCDSEYRVTVPSMRRQIDYHNGIMELEEAI